MVEQNPLERQPSNTDGTRAPNFQVVFARMPITTYFCQSAVIPGLTLGVADFPTPFVNIPEPGEILVFESFNATFEVTEDLANWKEISDWMFGLGFPKEFGQFRTLDDSDFKLKSDFTLQILTNALNPCKEIRFYDGFPVSLGSVEYNTTSADSGEIVTSTFEMRYSHYEFKERGEI